MFAFLFVSVHTLITYPAFCSFLLKPQYSVHPLDIRHCTGWSSTSCLAGTGRTRLRTSHGRPDWEQKYSWTLSLTSALEMGGWLTPRPCCFTSGKEIPYPSYRRLGGSLDRSGRVWNTSSYRSSIPGPSSTQKVAVPATLSQSADQQVVSENSTASCCTYLLYG